MLVFLPLHVPKFTYDFFMDNSILFSGLKFSSLDKKVRLLSKTSPLILAKLSKATMTDLRLHR